LLAIAFISVSSVVGNATAVLRTVSDAPRS